MCKKFTSKGNFKKPKTNSFKRKRRTLGGGVGGGGGGGVRGVRRGCETHLMWSHHGSTLEKNRSNCISYFGELL